MKTGSFSFGTLSGVSPPPPKENVWLSGMLSRFYDLYIRVKAVLNARRCVLSTALMMSSRWCMAVEE